MKWNVKEHGTRDTAVTTTTTKIRWTWQSCKWYISRGNPLSGSIQLNSIYNDKVNKKQREVVLYLILSRW